MAGLMKLACLVFACMIVAGPITANAVLTCTAVRGNLKGCFDYLLKNKPLSLACCSGVRNLIGIAHTTADRRQACRCLQNAARNKGPSLKTNRAAAIPRLCRVKIPHNIQISRRTNCNTLT
ncbi:hypothetical protein CARUB_v10014941mg [Capsella rubella]|uniref:Non-specific lipid-transfer protein n=1 Tax=Capsella rubella TaxID=81985 RepID=R0G2U8_9BRAS|nr:non-specific lipid-transfer protein 2 [Capsella rubella]EOA29641.1 hypothetical protein CARUB_v10014941mg [Capsella rubella]